MRRGDNLVFENPVYVKAWACAAGKKEGEGPLGRYFDHVDENNGFAEKTWEKAETAMLKTTIGIAMQKAALSPREVDCFFGGDLLNQCISTNYALRDFDMPFLGIYGACSTMAESLLVGGTFVSGGFHDNVLCAASSHFCSAERQYRFPLEYGGQRPPTAQWTATASGVVALSRDRSDIKITSASPGRVFDPGVTDANNMGAAMALSAYETLKRYFKDSGSSANDYDLIVTGDLAKIGKGIVLELFERDGVDLRRVYDDCGMMIYSGKQDVHAGASGCGCSAAALCAYILPAIRDKMLKRVLLCGTGALLSPIATCQKESIPGICHLVCIEGVSS